ncbi:SDR family oxidoreductase [Castellaniella defragrans]|uniref:Short chain dehydrogenase n=1 Tax=Castellaniella defragrans (strain DSM 12143 / CCUG 39792 / 65Phen) TaxID=1437824 RepID=W8WVS3_CASD6|nr:SDR family oxidoreductase [Castellaniella defragrans]CDM23823.1 Short chain dehydrogenase [Castellaniella defragrans 65Phen]
MFENISMKDKKVLITAGASGLGLEMARVFAAEGARVFLCDVDEAALAAVRRELPAAGTVVADVSDEDSVAALFDAGRAFLGGLDVLVNNAGIAGPTGAVETISRADWDRTLAVNITGQFLCARQAIPLLRQSPAGVILNLSSAAGHLGFAGRSAYAASKWAVVGFTKTLAIELGKDGIRVNAILPGAVEGPRIRAVIEAKAKILGRPVEEIAARYENQASLGRMVTARDIANMALFAASGAAAGVSGQTLVVDGHTQQLV